MSKQNGDKARSGVEQKKKLQRRKRTQELRLAIAAAKEAVIAPAQSSAE